MRQDAPVGPRPVLTMPEIKKLFRLSRSQIHRHMKANKFPKSHKSIPGCQRSVWYEDEIVAFQNGTWVAPE
jgi:predicted DNA-binding transcriptional regulator AlpA